MEILSQLLKLRSLGGFYITKWPRFFIVKNKINNNDNIYMRKVKLFSIFCKSRVVHLNCLMFKRKDNTAWLVSILKVNKTSFICFKIPLVSLLRSTCAPCCTAHQHWKWGAGKHIPRETYLQPPKWGSHPHDYLDGSKETYSHLFFSQDYLVSVFQAIKVDVNFKGSVNPATLSEPELFRFVHHSMHYQHKTFTPGKLFQYNLLDKMTDYLYF